MKFMLAETRIAEKHYLESKNGRKNIEDHTQQNKNKTNSSTIMWAQPLEGFDPQYIWDSIENSARITQEFIADLLHN